MSTLIRVVVEDGKLKPFGPLEFMEGQELDVAILTSEKDRAIAALGDRVIGPKSLIDEEIDEEALLKEIEDAFRGQPPLSETIIEERRKGP